MPDTGYKLPGTGATFDYLDGNTWTNPTYIQARDAINARVTIGHDGHSDWLRGTNFGFDAFVPAGATIDGILVRIRRYADSGAGINDCQLYLWNGSANIGDNKAAVAVPWPTTLTDKTYGGASDKWGATLTDTLIRSSGFGVQLWAGNLDELVNRVARVDCFEITVYYTAATINHRRSCFFKMF